MILAFSHTMLPQRLASIRRLHINFPIPIPEPKQPGRMGSSGTGKWGKLLSALWQKDCQIIAQMAAADLQCLEIELDVRIWGIGPSYYHGELWIREDVVQWVLNPLMDLIDLPVSKFSVTLRNWPHKA